MVYYSLHLASSTRTPCCSRFVEKHVGVDDVGAAAEQLYENFQEAVRAAGRSGTALAVRAFEVIVRCGEYQKYAITTDLHGF